MSWTDALVAVVVASVVGLDALQYALHSDARNFEPEWEIVPVGRRGGRELALSHSLRLGKRGGCSVTVEAQ